MADQTFAERLRTGAQVARFAKGQVEVDRWATEPASVLLRPDEAEAVADLVDAAQRVEQSGWGEDAPAACVTAHLDLRAALARVAVKSAEGQPGS